MNSTDLSTPEVLCHVENGIGHLVLNRPQALNALSLGMIRTVQAALNAWTADPAVLAVVLRSSSPKALCAGGDIRFFHQAHAAGDTAIEDFFTEEYRLNLCIAHYPKPYIALMHGVVMGGGMGIAATASLRVLTETSKLAMPETKIGLFPDVGGTHLLSHLPADETGSLGRYVALTGRVLRADEALYAGLGDVYCDSAAIPALLAGLASKPFATGAAVEGFVRAQIGSLPDTVLPGRSALAQARAWIDAAFASPRLAHTINALENMAAQTDASGAWAQATLADLLSRSPQSLCITAEALERAKKMSLAQALRMERNVVHRCFATGEPSEGIRALVMDKDHSPRWRHANLAAISAAELAGWFKPVWDEAQHPLN